MLPLQVLARRRLVLGVRLARTQLTKVCFITLYTSLLSPASTAPMLAVVGRGCWLGTYVCMHLSMYMHMYIA